MDFILFFLLSPMILIMEEAECRSYLQVPVSSVERGTEINTRAQYRQKRCSCDNLKDKECVYFCHIGIVWVNTPSQVIPYGVGSFKMRLKRDVRRCFCRDKRDTECWKFCLSLNSQGENEVSGYSHRIFKETFKAIAKEKQNNSVQKT